MNRYSYHIARLLLCGLLFAQVAAQAQDRKLPEAISPYFAPVSGQAATPDEDGFIRRWLLLEPIPMPIKSNVVFTDSYLRETFSAPYFPNQTGVLPKAGTTVKVGKNKLKWHALDSKLFNVKLFRFATSFNKPKYGVMFWAVTVIDSPEEMHGVRLAVGSNSASMWWLNGEEAVMLQGDRRMVKDDVVSGKLTLKKGRNVLRGAVINGPGMSDFCIRLIDGQGTPVRNISINVK
jgi:hypothetical protein